MEARDQHAVLPPITWDQRKFFARSPLRCQGELPLSYPVTVRAALPFSGVGGGLTEFVVSNPQSVLFWTRILPF
jgi:hypothetical protein